MKRQSQTGWSRKLSHAWRGLRVGIAGQSSFWVHIPATILVLGMAIYVGLETTEIAGLALCVGLVWVTEYINSGLEYLAHSVTLEENEAIKNALDISAAAVLIASLTAVVVGALLFGQAFLNTSG